MEPVQVRIYTPKPLPRLDYIASIILGDILGVKWKIVTGRDNPGNFPVINYSTEKMEGSFMIYPHTLLSERGVMNREISITEWQGLPAFFQTNNSSDLPFDIFAASFWLVTRYEEYLPFQPDEHGRFRASESLAYRHRFLDKPLIELWAWELARSLLKRYPAMVFMKSEYKALLTVDIDVPFAYQGRSLLRNIGGAVRDVAMGRGSASDRYRVIAGKKKDPYQVFDYIIEKIDSTGSDARFFFSVGDYSAFDKNPSWENEDYRQLIIRIASRFKPGVHPSYFAPVRYDLLESQLFRLKTITGQEITANRFHYLRLFFPQSYRDLINSGITEDYSLCFHDEPGYRACIAKPFMFYDLIAETLTCLRIIPFQVMDVTLFQYKKLNPEAASDVLSKLISETRSVGGLFVSLWHNTSLPETAEGRRWRGVFESMLQLQQQ